MAAFYRWERLNCIGTPEVSRRYTRSFPLMSELPTFLETSGWSWEQIKAPAHPSDGFWVGTDQYGQRWLAKLRGSFYAYREIVFARLAQDMEWSCQSSTFIRLDADSAHRLNRDVGEVHGAHWSMEEHVYPPCGTDCALFPLVGHEVKAPSELNFPGVSGLIDWPKSEIAAHIFGGNEPPGRLFTVEHEFVIIDSEQMFSTNPSNLDSSHGCGSQMDHPLSLERRWPSKSANRSAGCLPMFLTLLLRFRKRWMLIFDGQ